MSDRPPLDGPLEEPDDEAAAERERRRQEREERRRQEGRPEAGLGGGDSASAEFGPARLAERLGQPGPGDPDPPAEEEPEEADPAGEASRGGWGPGERGPARSPGNAPRTRASARARRAVAIALLLAGTLVAWFVISLVQPLHGEGGERINVVVPEGAGVGEVAGLLDERGVISDPTLFEIRVTLAGKRSEMYPGSYTMREGMSYGAAINALSTVPVERTVTATIPEGLSRSQVADVVGEAGLPGDYMRASRSSERLDPSRVGGPDDATLEGFLFPATYELPADAGASALVDEQVRAFKDRMAGVDLEEARSVNLTVFDVVTIASMVEREIAEPRERPVAASVIYNRLSETMPLGIDATTRYAVGNFDSPLTRSELETDSPYNTRDRTGLPPGPIGNPGEESLRAAASPAETDFLYYVVEPGTCNRHSFSETYEEFERDVAEYNQAREEAGGSSPTECP